MTGKIEYSPDFKTGKGRPPKDGQPIDKAIRSIEDRAYKAGKLDMQADIVAAIEKKVAPKEGDESEIDFVCGLYEAIEVAKSVKP